MAAVVVTGCFDILHCGHLKLLMTAKELSQQLGVHLYALVNSDRYLERHKKRCAVPFKYRKLALKILGFTVMRSDDHIKTLNRLRCSNSPIYYVNMESKKNCDEVHWFQERSFPVIFVEEIPFHTSNIVNNLLRYQNSK